MPAKPKQKDYLAIAKRNITKPSKVKRKWRLLVYSKNKKGKTRFCMSADTLDKAGKAEGRLLIIDPEQGTVQYPRSDPHVWYVKKWEDLDDIWGALRTGKVTPKFLGLGDRDEPYDWVALDGMTKINNMALRFIMRKREETSSLSVRPGIVDRRDYNKSGELIKELLLMFDALPINVIYTAQERMLTPQGDDDGSDETDESSVFFVPDLPAGARGSVNSIVDVIGRLYVTKAMFKNPKGGEPIEKNQRRLFMGLHPAYDTGFRSELELPDVLKNPTVPRLVKLLEEGVS